MFYCITVYSCSLHFYAMLFYLFYFVSVTVISLMLCSFLTYSNFWILGIFSTTFVFIFERPIFFVLCIFFFVPNLFCHFSSFVSFYLYLPKSHYISYSFVCDIPLSYFPFPKISSPLWWRGNIYFFSVGIILSLCCKYC